jgi:hypothetical protein
MRTGKFPKIFFRLSLVLSIMMVLCAGSRHEGAVSAQGLSLDASFFPLLDGGWNSYDDGSTIRVLADNDSYVMKLFGSGGTLYENRWLTSDTEGLKETKAQMWVDPYDYRKNTQNGAPRGAAFVDEFHLWSPSFVVFPWGLKVGESRIITGDEEISIPSGNDGAVGQCAVQNWTSWKYVRQEATVTVEKQESITTPAGTFNTLKVTYLQREKNNPLNSPCDQLSQVQSTTFWLAPGVGIVQQLARGSVIRLTGYAQNPTAPYLLGNRGGFTLTSAGGSDTSIIGYARIQPDPGKTTPAGVAIFGLRQNGVLVTEAGVPASPLMRVGRIYALMDSAVSTGIAIANPNDQAAEINYYFTDAQGVNFGAGKKSIPPNSQISLFLDQSPFNAPLAFRGTFSLVASIPVSVVALRGSYNERHEFLITTLPVSDLATVSEEVLVLSHFAYGGGWTTQVVLVNPTDNFISGAVQFWGQGSPGFPGQPANVIINGQSGSSFPYSMPPRTSSVFQTTGAPDNLMQGSARIVPDPGQKSPSGLGIFSFKNRAGFTISEAGVPTARPAAAFRMYVAATGNFGDFGSAQSGVAVANLSSNDAKVDFEATGLDGAAAGYSGSMVIPGLGQRALFLNGIPGFQSVSTSFQGILRVSTGSAAGITVVGLLGRYNERGDFLVTTIPSATENGMPTGVEVFFPQLVDGGGYHTQFVLVNAFAAQPTAGIIRFFRQTGQGLVLPLK